MYPKYVTVHSTGNPRSTARNERGWLTNPSNTRQASYHRVVDETECIECVPIDEVAWACGDGYGDGNMHSVSIEICESGDRAKTLDNAAKEVARLLLELELTTDDMRKHQDWSGKYCPRIILDVDGWEEFKQQVNYYMEVIA